MPAVPAWPADSGVRLFVNEDLSGQSELTIDGASAHYLTGVMRLREGARLTLFDDRSGEWRGEVVRTNKRSVDLRLVERTREREGVPDLWLGAVPIRRARYDWVAEKACELGVARFTPVLTRRAVIDKVKDDRLRAHMIEAAEQCGRTALPVLDGQTELRAWLARLEGRRLYFADEEGGAPLREAVVAGPAAILIGPEGGFDSEERALIKGQANAVPVTLGPRILRADTAAVAAVATWMALVGD